MKLCALTMVYRDYWALTQWYRHYAALLGPENLYVVIHGADDSIKNICPNANLIHVPRDDFTKFDKRRANLLNGIANGLRAMFDWVIRVDADELICFDPARYSSLQDMFEQSGGPPALFALGLNLVEMPDDTDFDTDIPMRVQRSSAAFSGHYSKAFATSGPADLLRHGVKVIEGELRKFPYTLPRGVFLVHLKYANLSANAANDIVRMQVATPTSDRDEGLPRDGWRYAVEDTQKFLNRHQACDQVSWLEAENEAYSVLSKSPRRVRRINFIKAASTKFHTRTTLPDWLSDTLP